MKKLKVLICSFFVLCCGLVFVACGEKPELKNFDVNNIIIDIQNGYIYNGTNQAFNVSYNGVNVDVKYALESDKNNFKSLADLGTKDAGIYEVYYQISADGYNTYTSAGTIEFEIKPRNLVVLIEDYNYIKSSGEIDLSGYTIIGNDVVNDNIGLSIGVGKRFDDDANDDTFSIATAQLGEEYEITCEINNDNYNLIYDPAKLCVVECVSLKASNDEGILGYYPSIQDAINAAQDGYTIVLNSDIVQSSTVNINKNVTIDGGDKFKIQANTSFYNGENSKEESVASMFMIDGDYELSLKNINVVDGKDTVRIVTAFDGKLVVENSILTKGADKDEFYSAGVYIAKDAQFKMESGQIIGNNVTDTEHTKYGADLWIESTSAENKVMGGAIGNVFVAATPEHSAQLVLNGGEIGNIYVESQEEKGGQFTYTSGTVQNLMVSMKNNRCDYLGVYHTITPSSNTTYEGGRIAYDSDVYASYGDPDKFNISLLTANATYVFDKCNFKTALKITKNVKLIFNNCTFLGGLYVTSVGSLIVNNCLFNGEAETYALDVNLYSQENCSEILIVNNVFSNNCGEKPAISIKQRLGATDHPTDDWAQGQTEGKITGWVKILNNQFFDSNNTICIGEDPQGEDTTANSTTGDFKVLVEGNFIDLTIYNKFKDAKNSEKPSKINIKQKTKYDSTQQQD